MDYHGVEQTVKPIALLAVLATSTMAADWDIEQVDSAGWGDGVQMRWHPGGRLVLCYSDTLGSIRLAYYDTAWHYEAVPTEFQPDPSSQAFDVSPAGSIGITYCCDSGVWFVENSDTRWTEVPGCSLGQAFALPAYHRDGTFSYVQPIGDCIMNVVLAGTMWTIDTIARPGAAYEWLTCRTNRVLPDGRQVCTMTSDEELLLMGGVFYCVSAGDSWARIGRFLRMHQWFGAVGCDADTFDSIRLCYETDGWGPKPFARFEYDEDVIDTVGPGGSALCVDALNRPQIAYARPDLYYTYGDSSGWHNQEVDGRSVLALDMVLSESCQPIIAFANDSGVFLARGVDVAAQSEEQRGPTVGRSRLTATVVRDMLLMPEGTSLKPRAAIWLLDVAGRRALDLHTGVNDLSGLSPGVYFVRGEPQASSPKPQAVRKVVITR